MRRGCRSRPRPPPPPSGLLVYRPSGRSPSQNQQQRAGRSATRYAATALSRGRRGCTGVFVGCRSRPRPPPPSVSFSSTVRLEGACRRTSRRPHEPNGPGSAQNTPETRQTPHPARADTLTHPNTNRISLPPHLPTPTPPPPRPQNFTRGPAAARRVTGGDRAVAGQAGVYRSVCGLSLQASSSSSVCLLLVYRPSGRSLSQNQPTSPRAERARIRPKHPRNAPNSTPGTR